MIELVSTNNKVFMSHILKNTTFDKFLLKKAEIDIAISYRIFGELVENGDELVCWSDVKDDVYTILKNKQTPKSMKFVFGVNKEATEKLAGEHLEQVNGFNVTIFFDGKVIKVVTGVNYKTFVLDKTIDKKFDDMIYSYFNKMGLPVKVS